MSPHRTTITVDPRHPVLVGAHELSVRTADAEPIAMMVDAARAALTDAGPGLAERVESVRVVKGIWPYQDPGRLVAEALELPAETPTALTGIGGNATYDLVNATASEIASGALDVALICGAESMRTRRKDRSEGRRSNYLEERLGAAPDAVIAGDIDISDTLDEAAKADHPVNFYAMAESVIRNRLGEDADAHLQRISVLWAHGSEVASTNPHAWIQDAVAPETIAATSERNRMVASPYSKLLTSNINVDQGAALVLCSYETAVACNIETDAMVFLASGSGAHDHLPIRARTDLDRSPAFAFSAQRALELGGLTIDDVDHLDLYSCFPASVQLARTELGLGDDRPFTMTGGLTFAGGPFNGYCTQALAHACHVLRETDDSAFLYGNGGYFSKHSALLISGAAPTSPFRYERVQDRVDDLPRRPQVDASVSGSGILEAYTVLYDRSGVPASALLSVLDSDGGRMWATAVDAPTMEALLDHDQIGRGIELLASTQSPIPIAHLA